MISLDNARLKELFDYDATTGNLIWKVRKARCIKVGDVAGSIARDGYRMISVDGKKRLAHRLVWMWHHGVWPTFEIDHINRNKLDNRLENLRDVPASVNALNRSRANRSGLKGVTVSGGRIQARIGKAHLGSFSSVEDAHEAFKLAHVATYGENSEYYEVAA